MSQNSSRAERSESAQYRKTGRSGSSSQQRQFSGGASTKGGGGASSHSNPFNRSSKKYNSNAPVEQPTAGKWNINSSDSSAVRTEQNGVYQQQQTHRGSDTPSNNSSTNLKPMDAPSQKITPAVPKSPASNDSHAAATSNAPSASSEPIAPSTPGKAPGDTSTSFSLQFGSISPGFVNVMQIPARTSSAPPNLDEQKKDQARYEFLKKASALPTPSAPKQHFPKKDSAILDQPNTGEPHLPSKSKRDAQVSTAQPGTQVQKPSIHPIPGMPMQLPFHQPQTPLQFGGPNPQIPSQAMSGMSLPMPIPMSLPLGNPPVQHSMFVPGLQPHPMQPQAMMHQGQSLTFSPPMGPQLSPQLGSMGMGITPQFSQQPAVKPSSSRKTVKITHPETHEELRLDSSPAPMLHRGVQSQSQPISSFPPNIPMNFYPSSYNATNLFYPPASSGPLNSTQVPPTSHPPRLYNQVTVRPPVVAHADREPLQPSGPLSVGKADSMKPSRLKGENSVVPHKEVEASPLSSLPQPKPGLGASSASSGSFTVERGVPPYTLAPSSASIDSTRPTSTSSADGAKTGVEVPNSIKDKHKKPDNRDMLVQDGSLLISLSSLPTKVPEAESVEAKYDSSRTILASKTSLESLSTTAAACGEASDLASDSATEEKNGDASNSLGTKGVDSRPSKTKVIERKEQGDKMEESSDKEVISTAAGLADHTHEKTEESSGYCSNDVNLDGDLAVPTDVLSGPNPEKSVSVTTASVQNEETPISDVSLRLPDNIDTGEMTIAKGASVLVPSSPDASRPENEGIDRDSVALVSPSPCSVNDNSSNTNVVKNVAPKGKKKKKDLYRKAEAAATSSDLYVAFKGPKEKKDDVTTTEGSENSSSISKKQASADMPQDNDVVHEICAPGKLEPDDWEDAAEISTPELGASKNNDGNISMTKRYSRDYLLRFVDQCTDLPEGFEVKSDIADTLMISGVSRELHPSPGRNMDRPVSRPDRRGSGLGDEDKWSKFPGPFTLGRGDTWTDIGYLSNSAGFRPGQAGNYGVLRNPRALTPGQYAGGILTGPMHSLGPQGGLQRNNSDSDRWEHGSGTQKGLMPYPQMPMPVMHKAEKKYEVGKATDEEEVKQRQLKAILNKLTPQNFEKLFQQVKEVNIDNVITLSGVISQIFDKALMEPTFCEMYANFCFYLAADLPELTVNNQKTSFKRLLLNTCQEEFERGEREEQEANKAEEEGEVKQSAEEREEKKLRARRRMLGNIRLIGELYKKSMLTERIMHECINKLLGQYQNPDEENIEALCKLMSTIGEMIDHPKAKEHMDAYYDIMMQLSNNMKLSSRVRFMLKDAIDLRKNKWQQRRKVEGPKKIDEVHRDAAQERQAQSRLARVPSMGNPVRRGPPMDIGTRSPGMLPSPNSQISGFRGAPPQLRGYGSQDARMDERHLSEIRNMSVPLAHKPLGDDSITLGPQGGLARGMAFRGHPSAANVPSSEMPSPGDGWNIGGGQNGFSSMPERAAYSKREDLASRYMSDRFGTNQVYNQFHPQEQNISYGIREVASTDHASDKSLPVYPSPRGGLPSTHDMPSDKVWPEEHLRDKSLAAIKEFYSARDEREVALCIKDLNNPSFYPSMISIWVTDSFERKDMERDMLTKLLSNLTKPQDRILSEDQLIKGFESVLAVLEDAVNDAPRAAEFLGRIFAKVIVENVVALSDIVQLIYEGGEEQGSLVEVGLAAEVLGSILEVIKSEKGESGLNEIRSSSNLRLEKFRPAGSNKSFKIDKFI